MAQVSLRIITNEGADVLLGFSADKFVNNVSTSPSNRDKVTSNQGRNGKSFGNRNKVTGEQGWLDLSDGYLGLATTKLQSEKDKYNGFMWGTTNEAGEYELTIYVEGETLDKIIVTGDANANQFPIEAVIDEGTEYEKTITSDDNIWAIAFGAESDTHIIKFTKWNRANYNACFTTIKLMLSYLEVDKSYIKNVESLSQKTGDAESIRYGFIANSGSFDITDIDGEIKDYIQDGIIEESNVPIQIYLNGNLVRSHITTSSEYNSSNLSLSTQLSNITGKLQNTYDGMQLRSSTSALTVLQDIMSKLGYSANDIYNMAQSLVVCDDNVYTVYDYLKEITINNAFLESSTFDEAIQKVCDLAQLNMFLSKDRKPIFMSARPLCSSGELLSAIKINKYSMFGNGLNVSLFKKNKIKSVGYIDRHESLDKIQFDKLTMAINSIDENQKLTYLWDSLSNAQSHNGGYEIVNYSEVSVPAQSIGESNLYYIKGKIKYKPEVQSLNILENRLSASLTSDSQYSIFNHSSSEVHNIPWSGALQVALYGGLELEGEDVVFSNGAYTIPFQIITKSAVRTTSGENALMSMVSFTEAIWAYSLIFADETINQDADYIIPSNELIKFSTTFNSKNIITDIIKPNILNDYKNGVAVATADVFCGKYYSADGREQVSEKDLIEVGKIVYFDNDYYNDGGQRYWRVTGSEFTYNGQPTQRLELQEVIGVKTANFTIAQEIFDNLNQITDEEANKYLNIYVNGVKASIGDTATDADEIYITKNTIGNTSVQNLSVNGATYKLGSKLTGLPKLYITGNLKYTPEV